MSLRRLDIIGKDKVTRRLQKNKSYRMTNRAHREGPKVADSSHSMGTLTVASMPAERVRTRSKPTKSAIRKPHVVRMRNSPRRAKSAH